MKMYNNNSSFDSSTFGFFRGRNKANFLAAASIEAAAARSSCSAMTLGSFGSTQSDPETC